MQAAAVTKGRTWLSPACYHGANRFVKVDVCIFTGHSAHTAQVLNCPAQHEAQLSQSSHLAIYSGSLCNPVLPLAQHGVAGCRRAAQRKHIDRCILADLLPAHGCRSLLQSIERRHKLQFDRFDTIVRAAVQQAT